MTGTGGLRRIVLVVALMNLAYFGVEFTGAIWFRSVALFADSVDFLEDASVNLLIFLAIGWAAHKRARLGMGLAFLMTVPAMAFLWTVWEKLTNPVPPEALGLTIIGAGALAVNLTCALLLARHRNQSGSLTKAAFLSSRNDAIANAGIIAAGLLTMVQPSVWPDLIAGLAIAAMNLDAAREVWTAARAEAREDGDPTA